MNHRSQRIASILLALTLIVTMLPAGALPPGLAGMTPEVALADFPAGDGIPFSTVLYNTRSVALGDIDGDGDLDIVTGNYGASDGEQNVVYLNDGIGGFSNASAINFGTGTDKTLSVALGDIDGDGHLDIVTGNGGQNVVYRNDGTGDFPSASAILFGSDLEWTWSVALGDIDGDGDLDIVTGNGGQNVVYRNDGTGDFPSASAINFGPGTDATHTVALGDIDRDGDLDIVTGNNGQPNVVYRNDGAGGFPSASAITFDTGTNSTRGMALGDIDGDGSPEIVTGNYIDPNVNEIVVYRNDGTGGFSSAIPPKFNTEPGIIRSLSLGDIDGDGNLDLVIANYGQNLVYRNDGTGDFTNASAIPFGTGADWTRSVAPGDIDGDGNLDLVTGNFGQNVVYRNDGTGGFANAIPFGTGSDSTWSVALGDIDGDGDLDLVTGNFGQNVVYRNDGAGGFANAIPFGTGSDATYSVALGDIDGDGDLDLVTGNGGQNVVYRNDGAGGFANAIPFGTGSDATYSVALGDIDGDGDLDLVTGNSGQPNKVYRNDGDGGFASTIEFGVESDGTRSVALGDIDGDGDLDIVAGNYRQNMVYHNDGSGGFANAIPFGTGLDNTFSMALGDIDGDGDLDIVIGTYKVPNMVYRNDGIRGFPSAIPFGTGTEVTRGMALGDIDGDGDLDIVAGNDGQPKLLYRNNGAGGFANAIPFGTGTEVTRGMALGDIDGDGDLDLVTGNYQQPNVVSLNGLAGNPHLANNPPIVHLTRPGDTRDANFYSTPQIQSTNLITIPYSLADYEGDPVRAIRATFSPDGGGRWYTAVPTNTITSDLATLPERFVHAPATPTPIPDGSNQITATVTVPAPTNGTVGQITDVAVELSIAHPSVSNLSASLTAPDGTLVPLFPSGSISGANISGLSLDDQATTAITSATAPFTGRFKPTGSLAALNEKNPLGQWTLTVTDTVSDGNSGTLVAWGLRLKTSGVQHTFVWDTLASGFFGQSDNVVVRLVALPSLKTGRNGVPVFQRPYAAATTFPFRVRGNIARVVESVDGKNQPVAGAQVYHLPSGAVQGAAQLDNWLTGEPLTSNQLGYVNSRDPILPGDRLAALQVISDSAKLTLYHTSPIDLSSGRPEYQITATGVQTLTVSPDRPLIAFKLDVSLEWDARNDTAFLLQLRRDLQRAAELLYDWTDGQATLGAVTIYHDKDHWEDVTDPATGEVTYGADIQIYASNRLRPNSSQGGIVTKTLTETLMIAGTSHTLVYEPGALRMPATWNRNGDPGGTLGEDWPRTLAHEMGHFALFLDDTYIGLDANNNLISVESCPGAMSDPYRDDWSEFQPDGAAWLAGGGCAQTLSARTAGRSDWATIKTFYDDAGLNFRLNAPASFNASPGPDNLALALTQITDSGMGQASTAREAYVTLLDAAGKPYQPGAAARAVLYQGAGNGTRAIDMGAPTGDLLLVRGARPGDTLCVYERLKHLVGCTTMSVATTRLTMRTLSTWQPDIQITPETSTTVKLRLPQTGIGALAAGETLAARLFPDEGQAITVSLTLAGGAYTGTGVFATPPFDALVRVCVADGAGLCLADGVREAVADYSLGGEPAPRRRKKGRRRRRAPALSADGQAILFTDDVSFSLGQFYAFQTIDQLPTPPAWATPVGFGYRLSASDDTLRAQIASTSLALGYFPTDVPAGTEEGITLYYLPAGGGAWQLLPTTLSLEDNTASAKARGEGLYALMASVPLALDPGWNLVYRYPGATQSLPAALAGVAYAAPIISTNAYTYTLVYGYDEDDDADPWKLYAPGLPAPWDTIVNDLSGLTNGDGYWIRSSAEITAPLRPSLDADADILSAPPATYYGLAPAGLSGPLDIEAWVGDDKVCGGTLTQPVGVSGQGFSLNVLANGGGDAMGCGYPGAEVRITFSRGGVELGSYDSVWENTHLIPLGLPLPHRIYLPLVHTPGVPAPDLQIVAARIVPAPPGSGEDYAVEVTVRNRGAAAVAAPFWVDLYVDPDQAPQPGEGWPAIAAFGASWRVYDLAAGATIVLSSLSPNDPLDPGRNYTLLPFFLEGETYTLYAQADAYATSGASQGAIIESDETNNIGGPYVLVADPL